MTTIDPREVKIFLMELYSDSFEAIGMTEEQVPDSFDLMLEGIIDSLGVLELVTAVEEKFQINLDLDSIDPEDLTRIGPFADFVAKHGDRSE